MFGLAGLESGSGPAGIRGSDMDGGDDSGWINNTPNLHTYIYIFSPHCSFILAIKRKKMSCISFFLSFLVGYLYHTYHDQHLRIE